LDAVDALLEATPDTPSYMIGMQENRVRRVPLVQAVQMVPLDYVYARYRILTFCQTKDVAEAIKNRDFDKAMSLRDPEFRESLEGFIATSTLEETPLLPPEKVRLGYPNIMLFLLTVIDRGYGSASCSKSSDYASSGSD
jgi:6-phosphofructokinase 1